MWTLFCFQTHEIANLCELLGADVDKVRIGIGSDQRIGNRFLFPGIGYGGSCFPKDVRALLDTADLHNSSLNILSAVNRVNEKQKNKITEKVIEYFEGNLKGKVIALWGLAFKPETDDIREAPSIDMMHALLGEGAKLQVFDPEAMDNIKKQFGDKLIYADSMYAALNGADAILICTEWSIFRTPDIGKMKSLLNSPVIFDGRNLYNVSDMEAEGFAYVSIGRKNAES